MQQGLLERVSRGSILEYHAFGIISQGRESGEHYLICGVQGNFTRSLFAGVSNTSKLYKWGFSVCTGTGLGAGLSTCLQSPDWYLIEEARFVCPCTVPSFFVLMVIFLGGRP
ncbi:hypothetical protein B0H17DRAFT_995167, partial [Mycena rosella]